MARTVAAVALLCWIGIASAQLAPTSDQVVSKTEDHSVNYTCGGAHDGVVSCDLVETSVRKRFDDDKVCVVGSHAWKQDFKLPQTGPSNVWIAQSTPDGPCGTVDLSRFEANAAMPIFFDFVRRKTVTNPNAIPDPLLHPEVKCTALEQPPIEFISTHRDRKRPLSCSSFEFVPY